MGVRKPADKPVGRKKSKVVIGAVLVAVIGAVAVLVVSRSSSGDGVDDRPQRSFFTIDDGKTWFADDAAKVPPFTKDGKEAVRAYVFKCHDGKQFVAYLERYTPDGKQRIEQLSARSEKDKEVVAFVADEPAGVEVKMPGQAVWIKQSEKRATAIMTPRCPGGGGKPTLVTP